MPHGLCLTTVGCPVCIVFWAAVGCCFCQFAAVGSHSLIPRNQLWVLGQVYNCEMDHRQNVLKMRKPSWITVWWQCCRIAKPACYVCFFACFFLCVLFFSPVWLTCCAIVPEILSAVSSDVLTTLPLPFPGRSPPPPSPRLFLFLLLFFLCLGVKCASSNVKTLLFKDTGISTGEQCEQRQTQTSPEVRRGKTHTYTYTHCYSR